MKTAWNQPNQRNKIQKEFHEMNSFLISKHLIKSISFYKNKNNTK